MPVRPELPDIPFQDLVTHHQTLAHELEAAVMRVAASGSYILGTEVAAFEREAAVALGATHAVGLSSGTDALLAILMALGIGRGDEVVTTPFSFFASAGVIERLGAIPVFADIDPETFNLDSDAAVARIGRHTKAVVAVHLFGRVARLPSLEALCAAEQIPLVEDAAQAIAACGDNSRWGRRVGTIGRAASLSFFPSKNLGAMGDGGMVITSDGALADRLRLLRVQGAKPKYHHPMVGGNFRLDEIQAAVLRVKLPHLFYWSERRRQIAARYRAALANTPMGLPPEDPGSVWSQFVIRVRNGRRDALANHLKSKRIATAIYYPEPLHLQPCFAHLGYRVGHFPQAERACSEALALPIYPELGEDAVDRICDTIKSFS
ncbi:MAG TPA: DegT/DnrJ/EryC1/StrS family aminotransferase [Polyangia bacterium]|jgi:dTDP-4-amino-4,6-dideoxygalactose transaminase|nr:DegT/DnrJ/EryC1/StrS family aminotransferase [Polyangia bacterium]